MLQLLEPLRAASVLLRAARKAGTLRLLGDLPGHEFHGNQWTDGVALPADASRLVRPNERYDFNTLGRRRFLFDSKSGVIVFGGKDSPTHGDALEAALQADTGLSRRERTYPAKGSVADYDAYDIRGQIDSASNKVQLWLVPMTGMGRPEGHAETFDAVSTLVEHLVKNGASSRTILSGDAGVPRYEGLEFKDTWGHLFKKHRAAGDYEGHPFHGNQWTSGQTSADETSFIEAGQRGNNALSRTAKGTYDASAQVGKPALVSTTNIGERANANNEDALRYAWAQRDRPATDVKQVVEGLAKRELKGMFETNDIWRKVEGTEQFPYAPAASIPERMEGFYKEFAERADDDPIATAAWVEKTLLTDIHPFVDAVGRTSRAVSAWTLARAGVPLPEYRDRKEYLKAINLPLPEFIAYYRTLIPKPKALGDFEGHPFHGNQWTGDGGVVLEPWVVNEGVGHEVIAPDEVRRAAKGVFEAGLVDSGGLRTKTVEGYNRLWSNTHNDFGLRYRPYSIGFRFHEGVVTWNETPTKDAFFKVDDRYAKFGKVVHVDMVTGDKVRPGELKDLGDYEGHPFHGNQHTSGIVGDEIDLPTFRDDRIVLPTPGTLARGHEAVANAIRRATRWSGEGKAEERIPTRGPASAKTVVIGVEAHLEELGFQQRGNGWHSPKGLVARVQVDDGHAVHVSVRTGKPRVLGDLPGHEFHGNQWTTVSGDDTHGPRGKRSYEEFARESGWTENPNITFFHGTTSQVLDRIKKEGLVPGAGRGADAFAREQAQSFGWPKPPEDMLSRQPAVFLADYYDDALDFADYAKAVNPGATPVVLAIDVPENFPLEEDTHMSNAWRSLGRIPPEWIVGKVTRHGEIEALAASRRFYAVILVKDEEPRAAGDYEGHPFRGNQWTDTGGWVPEAKDDIPPAFSFASQVRQYPEKGPPGIGYFKGVVDAKTHVDALLWRDDKGAVKGILNHYPKDMPPWEEKGNINIFVEPASKRQGIATALLKEAGTRWTINLKQQKYTAEGRPFITSIIKKGLKNLGGPGSGNFGHAGRPGEVGGSADEGRVSHEGSGGAAGTVESSANVSIKHFRDALHAKGWKTAEVKDMPRSVVNKIRGELKLREQTTPYMPRESSLTPATVSPVVMEGLLQGLDDIEAKMPELAAIIKAEVPIILAEYDPDITATSIVQGTDPKAPTPQTDRDKWLLINSSVASVGESHSYNVSQRIAAKAGKTGGDDYVRETYRNTAIHESGHIIDALTNHKMTRDTVATLMEKGEDPYSRPGEDEYGMLTRVKVGYNRVEGILNKVSKYALSGPMEATAEIFTAAVRGHKLPKELHGLRDRMLATNLKARIRH